MDIKIILGIAMVSILLSNSAFSFLPFLPNKIIEVSPIPIFAQISSTQSQLVNGVNTASNVTLNSNDEIVGITHSPTTNNHLITIAKKGIYFFIVCGQIGQSSGGGGTHLLWMQKNGINVANSGVATYISQPVSDTSVVTLNWVGTLQAGDKISFV